MYGSLKGGGAPALLHIFYLPLGVALRRLSRISMKLLVKAEERQDRQHNDDQADQID